VGCGGGFANGAAVAVIDRTIARDASTGPVDVHALVRAEFCVVELSVRLAWRGRGEGMYHRNATRHQRSPVSWKTNPPHRPPSLQEESEEATGVCSSSNVTTISPQAHKFGKKKQFSIADKTPDAFKPIPVKNMMHPAPRAPHPHPAVSHH